MIALLVDHLWQSTLFALGAGLLTLPLRRNRADVRYGLWFAASVKFLAPFAVLASAGGALASRWRLALLPPQAMEAGGPAGWAPELMAPATTLKALSPQSPAAHALAVPFDAAPHALRIDPGPVLAGAWILGFAAILLVWAARWSRVRAAVRAASPVRLPVPVPALSSSTRLEPGVVGLWRPVLVLPEGIAERLSPAELEAILAHELCHVRRRDNLTGAIHMLVQALFWFHPLVWWLGERLIDERERACDEAVVRAGHDRETYARGVIETCRLYLQAPLACVAGASGSSLEQRVDEIMCRPLSAPLTLEAKASIAMAGLMALTVPVAAGLLTAPPITRPLAALVQAPRAAVAPASPERRLAPAATAVAPPAPAAVARVEPTTPIEPARPIPAALARPQASPPPAAPAGTPTSQTAPAPSEPAGAAAPSPAAVQTQTAMAQTALAQTALAQAAPETPAEIRRQTYRFAETFGATTVTLDQLARWTHPICVTVQGLPTDSAAEVRARVEQAAGDVGLGTRAAGCRPNVQIMFTGQPQALLDKVAAEHEWMLGYWHHRDRDQLKTVTRPIQAWYVTGTGGGGGPVGGSSFAARTPGLPHGFQTDDESDPGWGPTGCGDNPHFTACLSSEFQSVLVVVDTGKTQGAGLGPIADYVAMLALAQPKAPGACNGLPSVVELFCPGQPGMTGLTRADVAYLTALYKTDLQARKAVQQSDIADRMAEMLIKGDAAPRLAAQEPAAGTARR